VNNGSQLLRDDLLRTSDIVSDISFLPGQGQGKVRNREPLLVNQKHTWHLRPEAFTRISNLFLASDYVRTNTDMATMEGANEAARRAVNGIIAASKTRVPYCKIWKLHEPWVLMPWRLYDRWRNRRGLPWNENVGIFWRRVAKKVFKLLITWL
jgi:15-cis-phytoene desaturase